MPADQTPEIGSPAWEAAVLRRQADTLFDRQPDTAAHLRHRADQLDPPANVRARHHADMERIDAADLAGTDTVTVMAVLRDIADAEPLVVILGAARCTMCGARDPEPNGGGHPPHPHPHLISCPWARTVQIVGVKTDG
jgi:hypothetical protein